jgi:hypothetical protein
MESFKRPEMIVSVVTATGLVGSIIYFYKQESALREKLKEVSEHMINTITRVREIQKDAQTNSQNIIQLAKNIQELNSVMVKHAELLQEFERHIKALEEFQESQTAEVEDLRETLDLVVSTLQDNGVTIDLRSLKSRRGRKGKKAVRRAKDSEESDDSSSEEEERHERPVRSRKSDHEKASTRAGGKKVLATGRILEKVSSAQDSPNLTRKPLDTANRLSNLNLLPTKTKKLEGRGAPSEVTEEQNPENDSDNDDDEEIANAAAKVRQNRKGSLGKPANQ